MFDDAEMWNDYMALAARWSCLCVQLDLKECRGGDLIREVMLF